MTRRPFAVLTTLALLAAASSAVAQSGPGQSAQGRPAQAAPGAAAGTITERLLLIPPAGWKEGGTSRSHDAATTHLFPPGQNGEQWDQTLSVQVMSDSRVAARDHLQRIIDASRNDCEASGPSPITEGVANGYPVYTLTVTCTKGRHTGLGGLVAVKAIRGGQALFVVERIWRGRPFDHNQPIPAPQDMLKEWSEFLRGVSVCDSADSKNHPCPK